MTLDEGLHSSDEEAPSFSNITNTPKQPLCGAKKAENTGPVPTNPAPSTAKGTAKRKAPKRSARACAACRERKVRCDVLDGAPCRNCRWNEVDCVVLESRRYHKAPTYPVTADPSSMEAPAMADDAIEPPAKKRRSEENTTAGGAISHHPALLPRPPVPVASGLLPSHEARNGRSPQQLQGQGIGTEQLPSFIKPLSGVTADDVSYLRGKGALTLPPVPLQKALLRAFIEYVYPCLPLLDLPEFLDMVGCTEGGTQGSGQVSLLLYQAIMFSGTAFVDARHLRSAGYSSRRSARRLFFQRTKLLHDLDCESDRLVIVQALLLMSYWHETPDDKRDMWHWIGVAVSLAYTIGLHRNPDLTGMPSRRQRLWKRVWWSCFIRDRLISLGLRRPTHITDDNFDIPMLTESDFEIEALSPREEADGIAPTDCLLLRNTSIQLELASISVAMAKLCICVGSMLRMRDAAAIQGAVRSDCIENNNPSTTHKRLRTLQNTTAVDLELMIWAEALPGSCRYQSPTRFQVTNGASAIAVQRAMLHMIYFATIATLHRTQLLEYSSSGMPQQAQNMSRYRMHNATTQITNIASELYELRLEKYLPTTGVTVILPAMTVQLLELKSPVLRVREKAARGFRQCMRVIKSLCETYAAAEHAVNLFETALGKSGIDVNAIAGGGTGLAQQSLESTHRVLTPPQENAPYMTSYEAMFSPKATQYQPLQTSETVPDDAIAAGLDSLNPRSDTFGGMTPGESPDHVELYPHGDSHAAPSEIDWGSMGTFDSGLNDWLASALGDFNSNQGFGTSTFDNQGGMDWLGWTGATSDSI